MVKAIFITVRSGSTRLPEKCFLKIKDKSTIEHLITRVKKSKYAKKIILCTTHLEADKKLCEIAERNGINFYQGAIEDKLMRWKNAAEKFGVEFFVTADGDDLFCEPELIDLGFKQYEASNPDFIEGKDLICGSFTYAIKTEALNEVCRIKNTEDTEMMWVYFTQTGKFKTQILEDVPEIFRRPEIRMTLDYEDDFKFFKTIIEHFYKIEKKDFSLRDIMDFLNENPDIIKINQYLQERFLENQKKKTKLILK
ncbi:MAG TPA: hypothetical protein PKY81_08085 [bacterium]|nr:hypothetical protein [bacterium]HPN30902.1 hypothetical protein [bacterium]